jgi:hypothetical protein
MLMTADQQSTKDFRGLILFVEHQKIAQTAHHTFKLPTLNSINTEVLSAEKKYTSLKR